MPVKLANHLKSEYDTDGYNVFTKSDYEFEFNGQNVEIPRQEITVVSYGSKGDRDLKVRCEKKINHSFLLKLLDDFNLELKDYKIIVHPNDNDEKWGYATVVCTDGERYVEADGEVHRDNLNSSMLGYCYTMLRKRTEDRAILRFFGLYQKGFYSSSENLGETEHGVDYNSNTIEYDNTPTRQLKQDNLLDEIKEKAKQLNISKSDVERLAKKVLGLEEINWGILIRTQKEYILNNMDNYDEILNDEDNAPDDYLTNFDSSESLTVDALKEGVKQYKLDNDLDRDEFLKQVSEVLDLNKDEIDIGNLDKSQWAKLYDKFINDDSNE